MNFCSSIGIILLRLLLGMSRYSHISYIFNILWNFSYDVLIFLCIILFVLIYILKRMTFSSLDKPYNCISLGVVSWYLSCYFIFNVSPTILHFSSCIVFKYFHQSKEALFLVLMNCPCMEKYPQHTAWRYFVCLFLLFFLQ